MPMTRKKSLGYRHKNQVSDKKNMLSGPVSIPSSMVGVVLRLAKGNGAAIVISVQQGSHL